MAAGAASRAVAETARVIGTAGHIDHGKTALVKALTGIDTDRLAEEKARGITIELGFAPLDLRAEGITETVGVVDVPGHERFVRTMVAGAAGIDAVVLVVAASEGARPQTREHLDICRLLGVRHGVVALSQCDRLAGDEPREHAVGELREALRGSPLEAAPIVPCSALTGEGLPELRRELARALAEAPPRVADDLLRLPLDRVFTMRGFGTVATGTLWSGRLRIGDEVEVLPGARAARVAGKVRGLQVHGVPVEEARAGQRTACNLSVPLEALRRGAMLTHAGRFEPTRRLDVRLCYLPTSRGPLPQRARALLHAGTAQTLATVTLLDAGALQPGDAALAQLQLDEPWVARPGDRFILRGFALQEDHRTTLGGGTVLRVLGPRHRRGTPAILDELRRAERAQLTGDVGERVALEVGWAGASGIARSTLPARVPATPRGIDVALDELLAAGTLFSLDPRRTEDDNFVHPHTVAALGARLLAALDAFHAAEPLQPGLPREALRAQLPVTAHPRLAPLLIDRLVAAGDLLVEPGSSPTRLRRPGHDLAPRGPQNLDEPVARILQLYRETALTPPRPAEAAAALGLDERTVKGALASLARDGWLCRVADLYFERDAVAALRERLVAFLREHGHLDTQAWKAFCGVSRKYAIPLAEYFDAQRLTLRVGGIRKLRGA